MTTIERHPRVVFSLSLSLSLSLDSYDLLYRLSFVLVCLFSFHISFCRSFSRQKPKFSRPNHPFSRQNHPFSRQKPAILPPKTRHFPAKNRLFSRQNPTFSRQNPPCPSSYTFNTVYQTNIERMSRRKEDADGKTNAAPHSLPVPSTASRPFHSFLPSFLPSFLLSFLPSSQASLPFPPFLLLSLLYMFITMFTVTTTTATTATTTHAHAHTHTHTHTHTHHTHTHTHALLSYNFRTLELLSETF